MAMLKHVGRMANNQRKVIVKYRTVPGDSDSAIVVTTENLEAAANDVPLWGFYRTGGIVKIRVSITPPHLLLIGPSTITINLGSDYIEQGVNVVENAYLDESNDIVPYLISIDNATTTNIIDTPIPITTTTIINIQVLPLGTYTITYSATDPVGNNVTKIRILSII